MGREGTERHREGTDAWLVRVTSEGWRACSNLISTLLTPKEAAFGPHILTSKALMAVQGKAGCKKTQLWRGRACQDHHGRAGPRNLGC